MDRGAGWLVVLVGAVCALTAGAALAARASSNPKSLVLSLSDLPAGFAIDTKQTGVFDNKMVALVEGKPNELHDLQRWGRISGYQAQFTREPPAQAPLGGIALITSRASTFRTPQGAKASFAQSVKGCSTGGYHLVSLGVRLGQQSVACTIAQTAQGNFRVYQVLWRNATVEAALIAVGPQGRVQARDVVHLTKLQDARIARALTH